MYDQATIEEHFINIQFVLLKSRFLDFEQSIGFHAAGTVIAASVVVGIV